jgi:hypothetical protein
MRCRNAQIEAVETLLIAAASGAAVLVTPAILRGAAWAQAKGMDLSSLQAAKVDWQQAKHVERRKGPQAG